MNSRGGGRCRGGGGVRRRWQSLLSNCAALLEHLVYDVCRVAHTTPVSAVIAWVSGSDMQTKVLYKIGERAEGSIPEREGEREGGREGGRKGGRKVREGWQWREKEGRIEEGGLKI